MKRLIPGTRVYIAGPMTGREHFNFPEFFRVEQVLADLGYDVMNPARTDHGVTWQEAAEHARLNPKSWEEYMRIVLASLLTCDVICLLDDWWTSRGANCEQAVAAWLKMPFIFPDGTPMATVK